MKFLFAFITCLLFNMFIFSYGSSSSSTFTCPIKDPVAVHPSDEMYKKKPFIDGSKIFIDGVISQYLGPIDNMTSPIIDSSTGQRSVIGILAQMTVSDANLAVESSVKAWNNGQGTWPQMKLEDRIMAIKNVMDSIHARREEIANVLMWEIAKTVDDALLEVDRTIAFVMSVIEAYREMDKAGSWKTVNGIYARVRRAAIGILLALGPFNYPFNETYATLIPALLAGNVAILKLPTIGGLAHLLTIEIYAKYLPPGVLNFVSGPGRVTVSPMMKSGKIDMLAFIGGSSAADAIIKDHPSPHRLTNFLQLEGKNVGVVLPDANLQTTVEQIALGALSYNGQRCTAIKLVLVHESRAEELVRALTVKINSLVSGLPWEKGVSITPLPEGVKKLGYLEQLISDAVSKGASVVNQSEGGGNIHGMLMKPAVVYPVNKHMKLWHEEQFGPVVPIGTYSDVSELVELFSQTPFGQQAALFTEDPAAAGTLIDVLSTVVGRININTQCGRSPDSLPFSGRRSSALGTMSVSESIRAFSIEVVVAGKSNDVNMHVMDEFASHSNFLTPFNV